MNFDAEALRRREMRRRDWWMVIQVSGIGYRVLGTGYCRPFAVCHCRLLLPTATANCFYQLNSNI
jgi:hypothetical protein